MNDSKLEELIELTFFKLGDPNRDGGTFEEIDNELRNSLDADSGQATIDNMHNALHDLRSWLNRTESALDLAILELGL